MTNVNILKRFNLSYSSYSLYKKSQLQFYYQYIEKAEITDEASVVYGHAGNVVHNSIEDYINNKGNTFDEHWVDYEIDSFVGLNGKKLDKETYRTMYENGINFLSSLKESSPKQTELRIDKEIHGIHVKAFIDLYVKIAEDKILLVDWKTNSKNSAKMHLDQRLFYSYLIWKIKNKIPKCEWVYLRDQTIHADSFSFSDMEKFDNEIQKFIAEICMKGKDISKYEIGDWKNIFNQYYTKCGQEVAKREKREKTNNIVLDIKGNFVFFRYNTIDHILEEGIDYKTRFDLPNKYWMQQQLRKQGKGMLNIKDVGTVHLYNRRQKCFPIGLLKTVTKICNDYISYYQKSQDLKVVINDMRDKTIMEQKLECMPDKLITDKKFRPYQNDAADIFMEKKVGVFHIATRGGKTLIAAEIIRKIDGKTLWLIDRIRLLKQTKKVLQDLLGVKIGEISGDIFDVEDCPIIIASVQSVYSKIKESHLMPLLYSFNTVIVDEFHKSAADSYQSVFAKLPNCKWRLGLSATPKRTDGMEPVLFSILGEIIFTKTPKELIKLGYLIEPIIEFYKVPSDNYDKDYKIDYKYNIEKNEKRHQKIVDIVNKYKDKKIMILTKIVEHGKVLNTMIPESQHIYGTLKRNAKIYQDFLDNKFKHLVITISKGGEGLDIPDLDMTINASCNKSDVMSEQVGGRSLTMINGKKRAYIIDMYDQGFHTKKHSEIRIKTYKNLGFDVEIIE